MPPAVISRPIAIRLRPLNRKTALTIAASRASSKGAAKIRAKSFRNNIDDLNCGAAILGVAAISRIPLFFAPNASPDEIRITQYDPEHLVRNVDRLIVSHEAQRAIGTAELSRQYTQCLIHAVRIQTSHHDGRLLESFGPFMHLTHVQCGKIENRRFFGNSSAIRQYRTRIDLQFDVVQKTKWLVKENLGMNRHPKLIDSLPRARMSRDDH